MANLANRLRTIERALCCPHCGTLLTCKPCTAPPPSQVLTDEERAARIVAILERAEARRDGRLPWPESE